MGAACASGGASMVLAPDMPEILRKPGGSAVVPFSRGLGNARGDVGLLLAPCWCMNAIRSAVGGAAATLDGIGASELPTPSLLMPIVAAPELICCCSWTFICFWFKGVVKGLEFLAPRFAVGRTCFPALLSAQSGVCEIPGVPYAWIGAACGRAHGFCSRYCWCAIGSLSVKCFAAVGPER